MAGEDIPENVTPPFLPFDPITSALAPVVYFDGVSTSGFHNGIANATLEALTHTVGTDGRDIVQRVVVAHLRMNTDALRSLRDRLDAIVLMLTPPAGEKPN